MLRASESRSSAGADGGAGMTPEAAAPCGALASAALATRGLIPAPLQAGIRYNWPPA